MSSQSCKVCGASVSEAFRATVLKKHEVAYFHCGECGLLQTEPPYWLDEAYGDAITATDTGLVKRNIRIAEKLAPLLYFLFDRQACYLDVAGGYGMLVRLMRDLGFDFHWYDKYSQNLLARGFDADKASKPFLALTAFEVLEHIPDPQEWIRETMQTFGSNTLIFTTETYEGSVAPTPDWWYYSRDAGQHITFCRSDTLKRIADNLNLHYQSAYGFHIFSEHPIKHLAVYLWLSRRFSSSMISHVRRKLASKTWADHVKLTAGNKPAGRA